MEIGISLESFQIRASIYDIFPYNLGNISINTNPVFMQGSFFLFTLFAGRLVYTRLTSLFILPYPI